MTKKINTPVFQAFINHFPDQEVADVFMEQVSKVKQFMIQENIERFVTVGLMAHLLDNFINEGNRNCAVECLLSSYIKNIQGKNDDKMESDCPDVIQNKGNKKRNRATRKRA